MKHIIIAKCGECPYMSRAHGGLYCINLAHHDEMSYDTVHKDCPLAPFLSQYDNELAALIDGAKPIIEIWKAKSPAQATWAKEWLEKANAILKEGK